VKKSIGIDAAFGEGMTAENSPEAFESAFPRAVFLDGADEIVAAAWVETAMSAKDMAEGMLIAVDAGDQGPTDEGVNFLNQVSHGYQILCRFLLGRS
jgi:hypothetical protein